MQKVLQKIDFYFVWIISICFIYQIKHFFFFDCSNLRDSFKNVGQKGHQNTRLTYSTVLTSFRVLLQHYKWACGLLTERAFGEISKSFFSTLGILSLHIFSCLHTEWWQCLYTSTPHSYETKALGHADELSDVWRAHCKSAGLTNCWHFIKTN